MSPVVFRLIVNDLVDHYPHGLLADQLLAHFALASFVIELMLLNLSELNAA